jgi:predicted ATP-dependent endonuclease of OLD family
LLTRADIDPDVLSISVVNCDGAGQIKDYIRLCAELGIDFYVIHDLDDDTDPVIKKRNKAILDTVTASAPGTPSLHAYEPTLETTMGTQKQKGNLASLLALLGNKDYQAISAQFPKLVKPIDEFVSTRKFNADASPTANGTAEPIKPKPTVVPEAGAAKKTKQSK